MSTEAGSNGNALALGSAYILLRPHSGSGKPDLINTMFVDALSIVLQRNRSGPGSLCHCPLSVSILPKSKGDHFQVLDALDVGSGDLR